MLAEGASWQAEAVVKGHLKGEGSVTEHARGLIPLPHPSRADQRARRFGSERTE